MIGQRVLAAAFIATQAVLIGVSSGQLLTPLVASGLACTAAAWPRGLRLGGWLWNVALLLISTVVLLKCVSYPYSDELTSWVVPAAVTLGLAEYLLVLQACLLFHRRSDGGLSTALPLLGIVATAGVFNRTVEFESHALYFALALALTLMAALLIHRGTETRAEYGGAGRPSRRALLLASLLVLTGGLGWQISDQLSRNVGLLRPWSYDFGLSNRRRTTGQDYVRDATLQSITLSKRDRPQMVALRVFSSRSPGYLRGKVFDTYFNGEWHNTLGSNQGTGPGVRRLRPRDDTSVLGLPEPRGGQTPFALHDQARGPWNAMRVVNDPARSKVYFTPLGTCFVHGSGSRLAVDAHQVVRGGISTNKPYTAFLAQERPREELPQRLRERLLMPSQQVDPRIGELAERIGQDASTPREKITAVEQFFQENFEYALGELQIPDGKEPLSHFLLNRSPAHCEFFASGAIVLLRHLNVPCRYVIGYIVEEQDEYGDYWLARNRHAHAWVEAFDEQQQRWLIVEPTPGMSAPDDTQTENSQLANNAGGQELNGAFALTPSLLEGFWSTSTIAAFGLFLTLGGTLGGLLICRPQLRDRILEKLLGADPWQLAMHRQLRGMDRRMRRWRLRRRASETLHQFARRITAHAERLPQGSRVERLREAANWYRHYATIRYNSDPSAPQQPSPPALP